MDTQAGSFILWFLSTAVNMPIEEEEIWVERKGS
ncbi:hypothetical protein G159_01780 [Planococcus glaciei CHR43]|nr:hypothetical protein G159_01780 [Planococcus glaciei CHR43]